MSDDRTQLQEALARYRAKKKAQEEAAKPSEEFADLIPDEEYERTEKDLNLDQAIERIDIIDAYNKWCAKMVPTVRGPQREGIKISCPIPGHADRNPSAWINLDKQTWYCAACDQGGDAYDLAAFAKGFPVPGYKSGADFHKLREQMAEDFGYTVTKLAGGSTVVTPPEPEDSYEGEAEEDLADVISINGDDADEEDDEFNLPGFDWRPLVPKDSFLDIYMRQVCIDDAPEEYHFFHALIALGFALGRDVSLFDTQPVYGNLFVCTLGRTGAGKSKAAGHFKRLIAKAMPHDWSYPGTKGVETVSGVASAEALIYNFQKILQDPSDPKKDIYFGVRGLIEFNELSGLVKRMNRQGSVLSSTLMEFYDMGDAIKTNSMTSGKKVAIEPFASALTTTQPRSLRNLLTGDDDTSGFLNRWLFITGREKQKFAVGGAQVDIEPAIKPLQDIEGYAGSFRGDVVEWSEEALDMWTNFFHNTIEPAKKRANNDLLVRLDLTMKKLILLFTANRRLKTVPVESVEDAIKMYDYLIRAYGVPAGQIGGNLYNRMSDIIEGIIKRETAKKGSITIGQINKKTDFYRHREGWTRKQIMDTLENLRAMQMIEVSVSTGNGPGRKTERYKHVG